MDNTLYIEQTTREVLVVGTMNSTVSGVEPPVGVSVREISRAGT